MALFSRTASDTGVTFSGSISAVHTRFASFSEVGALVSDSLGDAIVIEPPTRVGSDSYGDGTSTLFGGYSTVVEPLSVFMDVFDPYVAPFGETEGYYARLPFYEAEAKLEETRPVAGSAKRVNCSWHGTSLDPERGAFVLVRAGGELEDLVGERVAITAQRGRAQRGTSRVVGFVSGVADLDPRDELTITRRLFMGLSVPGNDRVPVVVERLS